jgi:hypothetical protein
VGSETNDNNLAAGIYAQDEWFSRKTFASPHYNDCEESRYVLAGQFAHLNPDGKTNAEPWKAGSMSRLFA